ncbi:hypothetical protein CRUP_000509 [Coryphaenoides rupestris]|nr:hypothetical protein CRUP_000509 [Coryphaenoides rupestris]
MALRVLRLAVPSGPAAFRAGRTTQTAGVHTSAVRNLQYGWLAYMLGERTTPKLKKYSKIISVEGNLASGKGVLAQKLAEKLGMLYMPEADTFYMVKRSQSAEPLDEAHNGMCNLEKFYTNPKAADGNTYRLQLWLYTMRLLQYSDALEHLLSTGVDHYNEIKGISICEFLPPHLAIYVDQPAEEVQKKLKETGKPHLQNVPLAYLQAVEDSYKKTFLPEIGETSEVLMYNMAEAQDVEKVVEDIEYLKFDKGPWLEENDVSFHHTRTLVQDKCKVAGLVCIPKYLPEITVGSHDGDQLYFSYTTLPGKKYAPGYNVDIGDKYIWLK